MNEDQNVIDVEEEVRDTKVLKSVPRRSGRYSWGSVTYNEDQNSQE